MAFTGGSPGITAAEVLRTAPIDYVRSLLGPDVCSLLDLAAGGSAADEQVRAVATAATDLERLLTIPESRQAFLAHLPSTKLGELLARLGLDDLADPTSGLVTVDWTTDRQRALLGFLGLLVDRAPDEPMPARHEQLPAYGLFAHQRVAWAKVLRMISTGERRGVLHMPTGVGKTRTAMHVVTEHLRHREPTVVVWLAHGRELLEQAASEFETAWHALGHRPVTIARAWGDNPIDIDGLDDGVVVLGVEKATAAARADRRFLDRLAIVATLTVFDEAHQAIAPTYRRILDALTLRPDASLLGLTATPGRTWADILQDERLAEFFAHQKVTLEVENHANPVTALIDQGYLARPTFRTVGAESGLELHPDDLVAISRSFDLPEEVVARLAGSAQWNLKVLECIRDLVERHSRVLVFAASVDHARLLAAVVAALGIECDYVVGTTSSRRRDQAIARFRSNAPAPMVLCNYGVLTTGFDAPRASAAVIARPTRSLVLYSQMVGRVIRGPKAGGTEICEIVTVVDPALRGFGDVAAAFENWEDVWGKDD